MLLHVNYMGINIPKLQMCHILTKVLLHPIQKVHSNPTYTEDKITKLSYA